MAERAAPGRTTEDAVSDRFRGAAIFIAVLAAFAAGAAVGTVRARLDPVQYVEERITYYAQTRAGAVEGLAANYGRAETLVLGDSISEATWLDDVCGRTFNAGAGGAKVAEVAAIARAIIPELQPQRIVVAVGTNHYRLGDDPTFAGEYRRLLDALPRASLILVGVPNSAAANAIIRGEAARRGATYVGPTTGAGMTRDGLHLTPRGAGVYRRKLQQACLTSPSRT